MTRLRYFAVTKQEPWQPLCDKCGASLSRPFYWTPRHSPSRTICEACYVKLRLVAALAREMYGPEPQDPRYS